MATKQTTSTDETVTTDTLNARDARALTESMTVLSLDAPGMYSVTTESGSEYTVDARGGSCTCPDATHRDVTCKHIRRARFAVGRRAIPTWVDTAAIDPLLGEHVDGPRHAVADGGRLFDDRETGRFETERVDGGVLVFDRDCDGAGRELAGFADVDDWDAIRSELARRGLPVGAIHHKDEFEPSEVGL